MEFSPDEQGTVLISPLNWGLGHATRLIPIIREWQCRKRTIILGGNGNSLLLLKNEFPGLACIEIPFPEIRYGKSGQQVLLFILQSFRLLAGIRAEHCRLRQIIQERNIQMVISDSRLGLHSRKARCILVTHQLHIQFPKGWRWLQLLTNLVSHYFVAKFDEVWVPDIAGEPNLAGRLSQGSLPGIQCRYIGLLSRFTGHRIAAGKESYILVLLGGPEPQRSLLEAILLAQLGVAGRPVVIAAGTPGNRQVSVPANVRYIPFAGTGELAALISGAELIICRSGYSSVMELVSLGRSGVLIPTPGQPEQEYLAESLAEKGYFISFRQDSFQFDKVFETWKTFRPIFPAFPFNQFPIK